MCLVAYMPAYYSCTVLYCTCMRVYPLTLVAPSTIRTRSTTMQVLHCPVMSSWQTTCNSKHYPNRPLIRHVRSNRWHAQHVYSRAGINNHISRPHVTSTLYVTFNGLRFGVTTPLLPANLYLHKHVEKPVAIRTCCTLRIVPSGSVCHRYSGLCSNEWQVA